MRNCAVFVDAGYLFAQGSAAISGAGKKKRAELVLNAPKAIQSLKQKAEEKASDARLLRIYWYDGTVGGMRPTTEQASVANLDDVKLRLGFINSHGQQKGVDSLIVTDMIELARLGSISDAILLSGDEDVRVGVRIAQNFGVRVHLLGIAPCRGSQSNQLLQEADTINEWSADDVSEFLAVRAMTRGAPHDEPSSDATATTQNLPTPDLSVQDVEIDISQQVTVLVEEFVENLSGTDIQQISEYWKTERGVPSEFDRRLLPVCRGKVGRNLLPAECKHMRSEFQRCVLKRS
jgi:uncharacterized LabA/DUF88 family protein